MKKQPKGEPGIGVVPGKFLVPNRREPLTERGPLCYVQESSQIHNFGTRDAGKSPASPTFVQGLPRASVKEISNHKEPTIQPGIEMPRDTHWHREGPSK